MPIFPSPASNSSAPSSSLSSTSTEPQGRSLLSTELGGLGSQGLIYALVIALLLMTALVLVHALIAFLYVRFVDAALPTFLRLPCMEFRFLGLLLIALSFYSALTLATHPPPGHQALSAIILATSAAYCLFLFWLSFTRQPYPPPQDQAHTSSYDDPQTLPQPNMETNRAFSFFTMPTPSVIQPQQSPPQP